LGTWHLLPLAGLQDIQDNDKNVLLGVFEQLMITSWG
jgi:hypothetical protein